MDILPRDARMPQKIPKGRRGLVLAGGGAKGAYAFGCLSTLKRLGFSFDVVAGTSVGALNAALWSSGSMRHGIKIWRDISFGTTYPPKLLRPPLQATFHAKEQRVGGNWSGDWRCSLCWHLHGNDPDRDQYW